MEAYVATFEENGYLKKQSIDVEKVRAMYIGAIQECIRCTPILCANPKDKGARESLANAAIAAGVAQDFVQVIT